MDRFYVSQDYPEQLRRIRMGMQLLREADAAVFVVDDDKAMRKSLVRLLHSVA